MADDEDLFAQAMRGVKANQQGRDKVTARQPRPKARDIIREHRPTKASPSSQAHLHRGQSRWLLRADGVSETVLRRLSLGQPAVDQSLDLHGAFQQSALMQVEQALQQLLARQGRVLRIVHGRGMHSNDRPVLKQAVYQFLEHGTFSGHVLAVVPEPNSRGGACLVLLRRHKD